MDDCGDVCEQFRLLTMEDVRCSSSKGVAEIVNDFRWDESGIEKIIDEVFTNGSTLSRVAHVLLFAELLVERYPLNKLAIYEATFKSLARNLSY